MNTNTTKVTDCTVLRLPFADRQPVKQRANKGELPVNVSRLEHRAPSVQGAIEDELLERIFAAVYESEWRAKSAHEFAAKALTLIEGLHAYRVGSTQGGSVSL